MKAILLGVSSVVVAVSSLPITASAEEIVKISDFAYGGEGCPQGSLGALLSGPREGFPNTLTLLFDEYEAVQGPGTTARDRQKNCNIVINFQVPEGFTFSLNKAEYRGEADLPNKNVRGEQRTSYSFPFSKVGQFKTVIYGPYSGDYDRTDVIPAPILAPCGGARVPLTLRTMTGLYGNDRTTGASMSLSQITNQVEQIYSFQWKRCSK